MRLFLEPVCRFVFKAAPARDESDSVDVVAMVTAGATLLHCAGLFTVHKTGHVTTSRMMMKRVGVGLESVLYSFSKYPDKMGICKYDSMAINDVCHH